MSKTTKTEAKAPKTPATSKAPKTDAVHEYGVERSKDLPWSAKKVSLFKALKALKATTATTAVPAAKVVEKAGDLTARDVRHYCYHAKAGGLVALVEVEGVAGYSFYLTAKGAKIDPAKELKAQETAKDAARVVKAPAPKAPAKKADDGPKSLKSLLP